MNIFDNRTRNKQYSLSGAATTLNLTLLVDRPITGQMTGCMKRH
jgi:hypothetical protein